MITDSKDELMRQAYKTKGWYVCLQPEQALQRERELNLNRVKIMSYFEYRNILKNHDRQQIAQDNIYIEDINQFLFFLDYRIKGVSYDE